MAQITVEFEGGDEETALGSLKWTPNTRHLHGTAVVLPSPFLTPLTVSPAVIEVPAGYWRVQELLPGGIPRFVQVTGDANYSALPDIDPATLAPAATPEPAWWLALQNLALAGGGGTALTADPDHPGLLLISPGATLLTEDPAHPGLYLIGT